MKKALMVLSKVTKGAFQYKEVVDATTCEQVPQTEAEVGTLYLRKNKAKGLRFLRVTVEEVSMLPGSNGVVQPSNDDRDD